VSKQKELTPEELEQRERMKQVLDFYNLDRLQFAEKTRTKLGYVNQMLSGKRPVSEIVMRRFCAMYQKVNLEWLMDGIGEMFVDTTPKKNEASKVEEPESEYVADPLSALRRLVDDYRETKRQVDALAAELSRLKAAVRELEERLN